MISWLFGSRAGHSASGPPKAGGEWVLVDKAGQPIRDRPAQEGDRLAHYAYPYYFTGTKPAYAPDRSQTAAQNETRRVAFALEDIHNAAVLDRAVFLLSQTPDGRRLLNKAHTQKFSFEFDRAATEARGAAGLCDYANKKIPLHPEATPEDMALTLKHELQHMDDIGNGLGYGPGTPLGDQIKASRLLEASARASEAVLAYECTHPHPSAPAHVWLPGSIATLFSAKHPHMAAAARRAKTHAVKSEWPAFFAKIIPAFMAETATVAFYERDTLNTIAATMPHKKPGELVGDRTYGPYVNYYRQKMRELGAGPPLDFTSLCQNISCCGMKLKLPDSGAASLEKSFTGLSKAGQQGLATLREKLTAIWEPAIPAPDLSVPALDDAPSFLTRFKRIGEKLVRLPISAPAQATTKPSAEPMPAYQHPTRTDGDRLTNNMRKNESTSEFYNRMFNIIKLGDERNIDHIHFAVDQYVRQAGTTYRSSLSNLIEAGFRAPIAAMPLEYVNDLRLRIRDSASRPAEGGHTDNTFSNMDRVLMDHWKKLADSGRDPVSGGLQGWIVDGDSYRMQCYKGLAGVVAPTVKSARATPGMASAG